MKDNKLEIGDKLYCIQYGGIQKITIVDRLTNKTAFCGNCRFKLELENGKAKVIGGDTFSPMYYYLETEELKLTHKKNMLVRTLSKANYEIYTLEELDSVLNILKINTK